MKKIFTLCFILMLDAFSAGSVITLPDEKTLTTRISSIMRPHFTENTTLAQDLAGQQKAPVGVNRAVELAMYDYLKDLPQVVKIQAIMNKPLLVRAILQDHPEAIAELVSMGLLE